MRRPLERRLLTDINKRSPIDYLRLWFTQSDCKSNRQVQETRLRKIGSLSGKIKRCVVPQVNQCRAVGCFGHHDALTTDRENLTQTSRKWRVLDRRMRKIGSFSGNDEKSASSRKKTKSSSKLFCRWCLVYLRTYENERNIRVLSSASYVAWNHLAINQQTFLAKSKIRSSDLWMIQKRWFKPLTTSSDH